ncbi:MAG: transcriptional regulator, MarR family [Devosia sp.]|nr:transcriptional regulator, MarR family [Devosia sp.]
MQVTQSRKWTLNSRPGHLVMRLARVMGRYAEARIQPLGTGIAGYPVLNLLSAAGEMTQKQLTERLRVEQSSMAQLLGRLERDGFVVRRKDPDDGRSSLVGLTPKAIDALPQINRHMEEGNDVAVAGMTDAEIETAIGLLKRMLDNFEGEANRAI